MVVIKPRTRGKHLVRQRMRLDRENRETLYAYAAFIGEDVDYVVNQVIDTVLAKDRDFVAWRKQHAESFAPRAVRRGRHARGTPVRDGSAPDARVAGSSSQHHH